MAYKTEREIEQDADAAIMGNKAAFMRLVNALADDPSTEFRCLAAFALMDQIGGWTIPQLITVEAMVVAISALKRPRGVYARVMTLTAVIMHMAVEQRIGGSYSQN